MPTANSINEKALANGLESDHAVSQRIDKAVYVLKLLRHFDLFQKVLARRDEFELYTSMTKHFVHACTASVRQDIVEVTDLDSEEHLKRIADRLFRNTRKPVSISRDCTLAEYSTFFTKDLLRWEPVAVMFTACGFLASFLPAWEPIFGGYHGGKHTLLLQLLEASSACILFCENGGSLSDLGLWVHYEHNLFMSQVLGYTNNTVWRHIGETVTHFVARGLHIDNGANDHIPQWLVEMRRRAFACTYVMDKLFCMFCGRPPRLSQRYCSIHIPLDLEVSDLVPDGHGLEAAMSNIAPSGWNTQGPKGRSYLRCLVMCCKITEDALELSLGPSRHNLQSRAE
jgi:hypothetical protein